MRDTRNKEQIFKNLRNALMDKNDVEDVDLSTLVGDNQAATENDISVRFAEQYVARRGRMNYCYNEEDIRKEIETLRQLHQADTIGCASENLTGFLTHVGVTNSETSSCDKPNRFVATLCEALTADNGSIIITSNQGLGTNMPSMAEITVVLAFTSQVVDNWRQAMERMQELYGTIPEQMLVTSPASGVYRQGRQHLYLILIEDEA